MSASTYHHVRSDLDRYQRVELAGLSHDPKTRTLTLDVEGIPAGNKLRVRFEGVDEFSLALNNETNETAAGLWLGDGSDGSYRLRTSDEIVSVARSDGYALDEALR